MPRPSSIELWPIWPREIRPRPSPTSRPSLTTQVGRSGNNMSRSRNSAWRKPTRNKRTAKKAAKPMMISLQLGKMQILVSRYFAKPKLNTRNSLHPHLLLFHHQRHSDSLVFLSHTTSVESVRVLLLDKDKLRVKTALREAKRCSGRFVVNSEVSRAWFRAPLAIAVVNSQPG